MHTHPTLALPADGKRYACWRPLVAPDRDRTAGPPPSAHTCLSALRDLRQHGGRWAVIMLRGGHFAAAVLRLDPARVANPRQPDKFEVLAHKSAHRYVVRCAGGGRWWPLVAPTGQPCRMQLPGTMVQPFHGSRPPPRLHAGRARAASSRPRMPAASTHARPARACGATTRRRCSGTLRVSAQGLLLLLLSLAAAAATAAVHTLPTVQP